MTTSRSHPHPYVTHSTASGVEHMRFHRNRLIAARAEGAIKSKSDLMQFRELFGDKQLDHEIATWCHRALAQGEAARRVLIDDFDGEWVIAGYAGSRAMIRKKSFADATN